MISTEAAGLILSIAKGVVKLSGRVDRLMAEKDAVTGDFFIPMPEVRGGPGGVRKKKELQALVEETENQVPDPLDPIRDEIKTLLSHETPDAVKVGEYYARFFPERAVQPVIDPDTEFVKALKSIFPSMDLDDESMRYAAFCIAAGRDDREIGYPWRTALVLVDVLAEFGAENTALLVHDENLRPVIQSVLKHFSTPELESFTAWSPLLHHALSATLNGVLDSRKAWQGENEWLNAVLNALVSARQEAGDDYLLGLLKGKGYRLLISDGLSEAAAVLGDEDAGHFELIAADILKQAAPLVKADKNNFRQFFQDHWGDLFRAGLRSLEKHGPAIMNDDSPLLRVTLMAMIKELANTANAEFISNETLFNLADATISALAADSDLISEDVESPWLKALINSAVGTIADQGIRRIFSKQSMERIINDAVKVFSDHPELIIKRPGLLQELVGGILKQASTIDRLSAEAISTAAVGGALKAVADNPGLLDTPYPGLVSDFAGKMAALVADNSITGVQASHIVAAGSEAILLNPAIFIKYENKLTEIVVETVLEVADHSDNLLLCGVTLVDLIRQLTETLARYGLALINDDQVDALGQKLAQVLDAGLKTAEAELGKQLDIPSLPFVLSGLVAATARNELDSIDPEDPMFKKLFADLALRAAA